ncbi:MAG: hypothetical protein U0103_02060 [Candidatus Obscuribacterales bacterium]
MKSFSRSFSKSKQRGFSLVTVTLFGLIATMWLTASITSLIPAYQKAAQQRYAGAASAAAEAAADWAIDALNAKVIDPTNATNSIDTGGPVSAPATTWGGNNQITVTVTVKNIPPSTASYVYDPQTVKSNGSSDSNQHTMVTTNAWRVVESVATLSGGITERVRVVLKPDYVYLRPGNNPPNLNPQFNYSLFGTDSLTVGPNTQTDGYNSAASSYPSSRYFASSDSSKGLGGDIGSFAKVTLSRNVTIGGSVDVTLQPAGAQTKTVYGQDSSTIVNRYMTLNGNQDGTFSSTGSNVNVLGLSNQSQSITNDLATGRSNAILERQSNAQGTIPPAPSVPPNFVDGSSSSGSPVNLGAVSLSSVVGSNGRTSNTTIFVTPSAPPPSSSGYTIVAGTTNRIQPGNYTASSLNMGDGGQIVVASDLGSQPFRLFVDGSSAGDTAINISSQNSSTNGIRNFSSPSNVQIYYNGTKNINISNSRGLSAVLYAPNANISMLPSSTSKVPFYGSFFGKSVTVQNAFVHFDKSLSGASYATNLATALSPTVVNKNGQALQQRKYLVVSWQEF